MVRRPGTPTRTVPASVVPPTNIKLGIIVRSWLKSFVRERLTVLFYAVYAAVRAGTGVRGLGMSRSMSRGMAGSMNGVIIGVLRLKRGGGWRGVGSAG